MLLSFRNLPDTFGTFKSGVHLSIWRLLPHCRLSSRLNSVEYTLQVIEGLDVLNLVIQPVSGALICVALKRLALISFQKMHYKLGQLSESLQAYIFNEDACSSTFLNILNTVKLTQKAALHCKCLERALNSLNDLNQLSRLTRL